MKFDFIPDSVSHFDNAYDVLKERGFIEQSTNEDEIRKLLQNEKVKFLLGDAGDRLYGVKRKIDPALFVNRPRDVSRVGRGETNDRGEIKRVSWRKTER